MIVDAGEPQTQVPVFRQVQLPPDRAGPCCSYQSLEGGENVAPSVAHFSTPDQRPTLYIYRCLYCEQGFSQKGSLNRHCKQRCPVLKNGHSSEAAQSVPKNVQVELASARAENDALLSQVTPKQLICATKQQEVSLQGALKTYEKAKLQTRNLNLKIARQKRKFTELQSGESLPQLPRTPLRRMQHRYDENVSAKTKEIRRRQCLK